MTETDKNIDYDVPTPVEVKHKRPAVKGQGDLQLLYKPEYDEIASRLAAVGFSCDDIAYSLGVPAAAITSWKAAYPSFKAVWKDGKKDQLKRLAAKALLEAVGYDYQTSKTEVSRDAEGNIKGTKKIVFQNHQSPQPNLLIFLLCNLSSQLGLDNEAAWKSRQKLEIESKSINLTISGTLVSEQITRLAGKLLGKPDQDKPPVIDAVFESAIPPVSPTVVQGEPQDDVESQDDD